MSKRSRENTISVKETFDNHIVIEWNNKQYAVFKLENTFIQMFERSEYNCEIIHNDSNQAMLNIEDMRTGDIILRQEVNPAKYKYVDKWVEDVE